MRLHTDIPSRAEIDALLQTGSRWCATLYLPTDPTSNGDPERIELKNRSREVLERLRTAGAGEDDLTAVEDQLADLEEDATFWRFQARTLAVFATPSALVTFRLPNRLQPLTWVSDRFFVTPLMRAVTFPQTAFVLALAAGSVRLLEIVPDLPAQRVEVPDLPTDLESAVGADRDQPDRAPRGQPASERQKVRLRQFARQVDQALRGVLPGHGVALVLAAAEPLASIFRSVCRYPDLAPDTIAGSPGPLGDDELVALARTELDRVHAARLRELHELFEERVGQGRTATDIADVARFATAGAVGIVFVDIDRPVPGYVDDTGAVVFEDSGDPTAPGVVDEIARRVWLTGGTVLAVRRDDVPGGGEVAAVLRYTP